MYFYYQFSTFCLLRLYLYTSIYSLHGRCYMLDKRMKSTSSADETGSCLRHEIPGLFISMYFTF